MESVGVTMRTYEDFFTAVLKKLKIEPKKHTLYALCSVAKLEGLNDRFNPLNSVVPCGKSTKWNSVGVQDYKSYGNGVNGTVRLLKGDSWVSVVDAMRKEESTKKILDAFTKVYAGWAKIDSWPTAHELLTEPLGGGKPKPPIKATPAKPKTHTDRGIAIHKGAKTVRVTEGDSLYAIAQREYGRAGKWPDIAKANHILKPYIIYPKETLIIP